MYRSVLPVAIFSAWLCGSAAAQKKAEPSLIEDGGKKVLVFRFGETTDKVTIGDLEYQIKPAMVMQGRSANIYFAVRNNGKKAVKVTDVYVSEDGIKLIDDTGREFRHARGGSKGGPFIDPGREFSNSMTFSPEPDTKAKEFTATVKAPAGEADLWRIVYPKKTWIVKKSP
jgi:hypothetical protein